jgi:hypothetical protein
MATDQPEWDERASLEMLESAQSQCPYCGEPAELTVDGDGPSFEEYVEDCAVCCRPWTVRVSRKGGMPTVELLRQDA